MADALGDVDALLSSFNALLALSRLESGTTKLARRPMDMGALMENLHDLFEAVFEEQDMQLVVEAEVVTNMTGDEALLTQALVNGLENVLAHGARAAGTVTLDLQDAGDAVILSVPTKDRALPPPTARVQSSVLFASMKVVPAMAPAWACL